MEGKMARLEQSFNLHMSRLRLNLPDSVVILVLVLARRDPFGKSNPPPTCLFDLTPPILTSGIPREVCLHCVALRCIAFTTHSLYPPSSIRQGHFFCIYYISIREVFDRWLAFFFCTTSVSPSRCKLKQTQQNTALPLLPQTDLALTRRLFSLLSPAAELHLAF